MQTFSFSFSVQDGWSANSGALTLGPQRHPLTKERKRPAKDEQDQYG
jgi:hypothetical protein